jgi:RecA/RadA recombinase
LDKSKAIDAAVSQIERQFGKGSIMRMGDEEPQRVASISTGSLALDLALGVGGVPRGRTVEIFGPSPPSSTPSTPWTLPTPGLSAWTSRTSTSPSPITANRLSK